MPDHPQTPLEKEPVGVPEWWWKSCFLLTSLASAPDAPVAAEGQQAGKDVPNRMARLRLDRGS